MQVPEAMRPLLRVWTHRNYACFMGGMSPALCKAAEAWIGHRKGGIAMAAIGACAGFGAICGSSLATAATMGRVALPELRQYGYAGGFSTATLAAGGTLGILIPPSIVLVIYAILTEQNIAKLFLAAFIPGVLAAIGYMIAVAVFVRLRPDAGPAAPAASWGERLASLKETWSIIVIFGVVIVGMYRGWFTPTEGAAVGAFGARTTTASAGASGTHPMRSRRNAPTRSTSRSPPSRAASVATR